MSVTKELGNCPRCDAYHFPATMEEWKESDVVVAQCLSCGYACRLMDWPSAWTECQCGHSFRGPYCDECFPEGPPWL